ncbi:hypothetical protein CMV30_06240 [Nibricoccus aquaticus]|uniref:DUF3826 domain-containing protein n=1 Tax=Nibricoccus aquaticus TaxID=2576891 RepID=A0A290QCN4_9BACT|nr:DUF3826 domain-containing protein [Nibricoccus aquaticus]ATC66017.1 hypothetical protein CMV30_06240 [Nibricoccus aquaticus]
MKLSRLSLACLTALLATGTASFAQPPAATAAPATTTAPADAKTRADAKLQEDSAKWAAKLSLNDAAKESRIATLITAHRIAVRDWHNDHPASTVPEGINPLTGKPLSKLDREIIADSAMPKSVNETLLNGLRADLTPAQVDAILDEYTIGKVAFTLKGYKAIVPDLTAEEEKTITDFLKQARIESIGFKSMTQISAIFEIYKTKSEQYLNSNGRSWKALYKTYTDGVKAQKAADAAAKKNNPPNGAK